MNDIMIIFNDTAVNGTISLVFRLAALMIFGVLVILSLLQFRTWRAIRFKSVMSGIFITIVITLSLPIYQQYLKAMDLPYLFLTPYTNLIASFGVLVIACGFLYQYTRNNR